MIERRSHPGLLDEALAERKIRRQLRNEHLQRRAPAQAKVRRQVQGPHAASTEQGIDPVAGEVASDFDLRHGSAADPTPTRSGLGASP